MTGKSGGVRTPEGSAGVVTADPAEVSAIQGGACAGPVADTAALLAEVLAGVVGVEQVEVDSHFFHDLGADSMVMARFCARVRKRAELPSVSMKDIYRNPTIASLAAALTDAAPAVVEPLVPVPSEPAAPARAGALEYVLCGTLQVLFFLGSSFAAAFVAVRGLEWISAGSGVVETYLRSVLFGGAAFLGACVLPILAKWLLIGRWKPQQIRIWSLAYVRFWVVKTLVRSSPLALFAGSPLYVLYLRALGAKVGRGVVIFSQHVPVCTDLLTIGDGTVIRKDSYFTCYRAHSGWIQTGAVVLGRDVYVGEQTVLDIETSMGDGSQLGHVSSLHAGQAVPAGQGWHGSVARPTDVDYRMVAPAACGTLRSAVYSVVQVLTMLALYLPLVICVLDILVGSRVEALLGAASADFTNGVFYLEALAISFVVFFGSLLLSIVFVVTVPRVLSLAVKPDTVYPLYGVRYLCHRAITRVANSKFLIGLFGDSSFIVPFLRGLGYDLSSPVVQTGSNFGDHLRHDTPYLVSVGPGTVCASELSIVNADYSSTSFRVSRASIGAHSFLGNMIVYPSQSKVGDNCLLATKVMVPVDGEVREGVGLLGSPSFEIPRTVDRDNRFNDLTSGDELRRRLAAKNRHNALTIGFFLLARWFYTFVAVVAGLCAASLYPSLGVSALALAVVFLLLFSVVHGVLVERASTGFRPLPPKYCSIYDIDFWRTERFFKLESGVGTVFNGTPFKSAIWRLQGVRLGKRLFDDGCQMAEKNLVTIGDDVTLNAGGWIQCHSQEDYVFKCDQITIGAGCTLGVGSFVLYGTTMGDGAVLAPDSFLMKGEEIPPHARWGGNPARELRTGHGIETRDVAHFGAKWHQ